MKAVIRSNKELRPGVREIFFDVPGITVPFKPGQYINLRLKNPSTGEEFVRPYSVAFFARLGVVETSFGIVVSIVENGLASTVLESHMPTDTVFEVDVSEGQFLSMTSKRNNIFVATGTGIAPFLPYLMSESLRQDTMLVYIDKEKHLYTDLIQKAESMKPSLKTFLFSDREDAMSFLQSAAGKRPRNNNIFLAGSPGFLTKVDGYLREWNVPADQIYYDLFV